jgi:hypothetical protein
MVYPLILSLWEFEAQGNIHTRYTFIVTRSPTGIGIAGKRERSPAFWNACRKRLIGCPEYNETGFSNNSLAIKDQQKFADESWQQKWIANCVTSGVEGFE